jgi:hypothetical protein
MLHQIFPNNYNGRQPVPAAPRDIHATYGAKSGRASRAALFPCHQVKEKISEKNRVHLLTRVTGSFHKAETNGVT